MSSFIIAVIITPALNIQGNIFDKLQVILDFLESPLRLSICKETIKAFFILLFIYIITILVYETSKVNRKSNIEYGSAKWGNAKTICKKYSDTDFYKNRLLTQNLRISETGKHIPINLITIILGGSGAGKSFFYCIPNLLQAQGSYVVLDPSGELLNRTGNFLASKGYKIRALNLDEMEKSFRYNPFSYIHSDDDILRLVKNLFKATVEKDSHSNDPMWDNQAEAMCMAYMFLIYYFASEEEKNMRTLMYLAREDIIEEDEDGNIVENAISALFKKVELENPEHIAVRFRKTAMKGAAKTILGVQTTLMSRLNRFNLDSICRLMDCDELNLYDVGNEKTALFLIIPAEDKSLNFVVSMLYAQLIPILYKSAKRNRGLKLKVPVHFLMDEFCNVVLPDDFLTILTTARKHSISFSIIIQAISQIEGIFKNKQYNTLMGNADSFIYLGSGEFQTQKYISERIGKETIVVKSYSNTKEAHGSFSESNQPAGRALLEPSEVDTEVGDNKALVKIRGNHWIKDSKINPKTHPNYRYTADVTGIYFEENMTAKGLSFIEEAPTNSVADLDVNIDDISVDIWKRIDIIPSDDLEEIIERRI